MAEFPRLKTGAVAQYGMGRELRGAVRVLEFLDGGEQRYVLQRQRRRWTIVLDQLDEGEAAEVEEFVRRHLETLEPFGFTDPWSGVTYGGCVVEEPEHAMEAWAAGECRIRLTVVEQEA
jgi:phage-related protein